MARCPTCNARIIAEHVCPRCKSDLTPLHRIEQEAAHHQRRARQLLSQGETAAALRAIRHSLFLQKSEESEKLEVFILACLGDFAAVVARGFVAAAHD